MGVQLAQPDRPVVCVLGEGSAQYAITAFWSAVAYDVPHWPRTFVIDPKGVIHHIDVRGEALDRAVDALLAEAK